MAILKPLAKYLLTIVCSIIVSTAGSEEYGSLFSHLKKCNANFTIVGMFSFHTDKDSSNGTCANTRETLALFGIFESLAMVYTVTAIRKDKAILPNIPLSIDITDSCNNVHTATRNYLGLELVNDFYANSRDNGEVKRHEVAIIGATTTAMGMSLSTLSNVYNIPILSYYATSPILSNKDRFKTFFRTVPSDKMLIEALTEFLEQSHWNLITVLHTHTDYSSSAFSLLLQELNKREQAGDWDKDHVCIVSDHEIINTNDEKELDRLFDKLALSDQPRIVLLLLHWDESHSILAHALKRKLTNKTWILSSDYLTNRRLYCEAKWQMMSDRIITVQLGQRGVSKFRDFVKDHVINNISSGVLDLLPISKEDLMHFMSAQGNFLDQIPVTVSYVIDAVTAVARGLHRALGCEDTECKHVNLFNRSGMMESLQKVNFTSQYGDQIFFDANGDINGSYVIKGFSNNGKRCRVFDIAEWQSTGRLKGLTMLSASSVKRFTSTCNETCKRGYGKLSRTNNGCCWSCTKCSDNEYSSTPTGTCGQCPPTEVPDDMNHKCIPLEVEQPGFTTSTFGIAVLCLATIGLVLVSLVCITFVIHKDTHIVKASNKMATSLLLLGIALGYTAPLVLITANSRYQCGLYIYTYGLSTTLITGSLFVKVNRMYRIFRKQVMRQGKLKFMTMKWQLAMILVFVAFGTTLATVIVFNPEKPITLERTVDKQAKSIKIACKMEFWIDFSVIFAGQCFYILCSCQAFLARKVPGEYNDSRSICASTFVVTLENIVCISLLFFQDLGIINKMAMSIFGILGSTTILLSFFSCKVYIILFQPEKNAATVPHGRLGTFGSMRARRAQLAIKSQETFTTDFKPDEISNASHQEVAL